MLLVAGCTSDGERAEPKRKRSTVEDVPTLTTALERTARYFDARPPRGDVGFLIGQASLRLSPGFRRWADDMEPDPQVSKAMEDPASLRYIEAILWLERDRPPHSWPSAPRAPTEPRSTPSELSDQELSGVTEVMSLGLRCDQLDATQRQTWLGLLGTPSHSYLLTHQLLSLVWGRRSGCLDDAEATPLRASLASALAAELLADDVAVNDLSLERMAMLCYADLCDWVSDRQTEAVVSAQHPDGSWGDGSVPIHANAFVPPQHTAGLGFYVLAMKWHPGMPVPTAPG